MKRFIIFLAATFIFFLSQTATAQVRTYPADSLRVDSIPVKKTTVSILTGVIYAPKLHYFGRVDSLQSSAILPTVFLQFDSAKLYASGTAIFLQNNVESLSYAGTIIEAGYKFGAQKGFAGNLFANKFFYNTASLPQSSLKEQVGINLNYLNKIVNVTSSSTAAFSNRTDFFVAGGLNHIFKIIKKNNVFLFTPTAIVNAGSQNFTQKKTQGGVGGIIPGTTQTEQVNKFNILSYDLSLPIVWAHKKLFVIATPTVVLPQNLLTKAAGAQTNEVGKNLFFVNLTALYSLKF